MAYIPTEWKDGDVITAEKLNNIEEGIEEAKDDVFYICFNIGGGSSPTTVINKTFAEIDAAYNAQKNICGRSNTSTLINLNKSFNGGKQMQMYEFYLAYVSYTSALSLNITKVTLYSDDTIETTILGSIS